jgi:hypothetical protein
LRALGPGSVSSLLKVALDVVYFILWIVALALGLATVTGLLVAPFLPTNGDSVIVVDGREYDDLGRLLPAIATGLVGVLLYVIGLIAIIGRLRKIFETLTAGDPFRPENVTRLRFIGVVLAALLGLGYLGPLALGALFPEALAEEDVDYSINLTSWFSVLVVFVLAEVFREGARLRHEAELTI